MKKCIVLIGVIFFMFPFFVNAQETESSFIPLTSETKYYKVTTYDSPGTDLNNLFSLNNKPISTTEEITEEEYESVDPTISLLATTETTYKKMTTTISSNGSKYRYQVALTWKNTPKNRSYDIIGIGHYSSVKLNGKVNFSMGYNMNGTSYTTTSATIKTTNTGSSATFKLPSGSISSLNIKLFFDVEKNTSYTITSQKAFGDYSHATSNVTLAQAQNHTIGSKGISLDNSISSSYDSISPAVATWTGNW